MSYKLLAADMDGTALSSKKELTPEVIEAINKATAQGKNVLFSTGRSISMVQPYINQVQGMRYAVTGSGASVIDLELGEKILYRTMDPETVKYIIASANGRYVMPVLFRYDKSYGSEWCVDHCDEFGFSYYETMYRECMTIVDDAMNDFMEHPEEVEKFNLFFANDYEADEVYEQIKNLPINFTSRTKTSLEINAVGVNKANGLKALCSRLGIDMSECIAVGDAENDEEMLKAAGLKVAMGNATDRVKTIADVVAPDCENSGVAWVINQYLLD